jgi:hypothetical protein
MGRMCTLEGHGVKDLFGWTRLLLNPTEPLPLLPTVTRPTRISGTTTVVPRAESNEPEEGARGRAEVRALDPMSIQHDP